MIGKIKNQKINDLFDELSSNLKNINDREKECKNSLNNFAKKNQNFLGLNNSENNNNQNKDPNNTIFLLNYDLLNIAYLWSSTLSKNALNLKNTLDEKLNNGIDVIMIIEVEGEANIKKFTSSTYKEYSGLAIQYMFNYKRNSK